jgi:outer membrane protein TolC
LGLTQSRNAKLIANNRLCTLLKLPIGSSIQVDKTIIEELPLSQSIEYWQNTATDSSLTLKKADFQLQQTEHSRKIARSERIPKIALYASNHLDGPITIDIDMKNNNINVWTVGVGLKYNLASLYKTNRNLKRADIARLQAAESLILIKENLETEVYSAYTLFVEMFSILETHKKSLELATLNYDVINRRYLNDLAIITDMLDATKSKLEAELNMANAKINLLLRYYNLKRVTGIL